ncbi:hypothetical protein OAU50_00225 [Planctomycetota bacterium]|nr:hypothetical protein [Planctomycetota bacterium]
MRTLLACVLIVVVSSAVAKSEDAPAIKKGDAKAELKWELGQKTYYKWDVTTWDHPETPKVKPSVAKYIHFMGYELDATGTVLAVHQPYEYYEMAFQFAAYLPNKKQKQGDTWEKTWELTHNKIAPCEFKSEYTFVGAITIDDVACMQIDGVHTFKKNLQGGTYDWRRSKFETSSYYDPARKLIYGWDLNANTCYRSGLADKPVDTKFKFSANWRLKSEQDTTSIRYLRGRVNAAIVRGVERLWKWRGKDGLFKYGNHDRGGTALCLLALLMCDADPDDKRIVESMEAMKAAEMCTTYDVGLTIMAIEAKYIPKTEKESFLKGDKVKEFKREVSKEDREHVETCMKWLLENQNRENDFWNYVYDEEKAPTRVDMSVSQYAALGLSAAQRMGFKMPAGYVKDWVTATSEYQMPEGPEVSTVKEYKPGKKKDRTTFSRKPVQARGWHYTAKATWNKDTKKCTAYGSMSCAGITMLLCGLDNAATMDKKVWAKEFGGSKAHMRWKLAAQESLTGGNAWLENWFSVTRNPNHGRLHYYYYLYSLERIAMMQDLKYIGTRDWYWEGAAALVDLQADDGKWGSRFTDTSFALLFLKRGTVRIQDVTTGNK